MRFPPILRLALLGCTLTAFAAPALRAQDTAHVVLVATTDIHGHATGWDFVEGKPYPGGLSRAASVLDSLRSRYPGQVVLVDAGDLLEGDPFAAYFATTAPRDPTPMVDALNNLSYDAGVPGNHEFNFGVPFFERAMAGARYPIVCANLYTASDSALFRGYTVVLRGGVRVAIGGLTTPGSMIWDREHLRGRLKITPVSSAAPALLERLRAEGDVAVVLIHSGMDGESSYDTTGVGPENVAATLAAGALRPDLVVVGHSHREMVDSVINGVHFVQPRAFARSVAVVHLSLVRRDGRWAVARIHGDAVLLDAEPENPGFVRRMGNERDLVTNWIRQPIGAAAAAFPAQGSRAGPTPLIGFIGEVERQAAHADLASTPAFSTRGGLPAGEIHRADLFSIYPYENTLRAIKVTGAQLRAYLEQSARYFRVGPGGKVTLNDSIPGYDYDIVWGADYQIDLSHPVGQRIAGLAVKGRPVAPTDTFTLALNNYRQGGGGGFGMLAGAPVTYDKGEALRDLLERAIGRDTLHPRDYARENWRIIPDAAANQVRGLFGLGAVARAPTPTDSVGLRILAVGALAGQLDPVAAGSGPARLVGGVAALKSSLERLTAGCDCPVVRLAAGDLLEGSRSSDLVHGQSMVEALNRLGLAATAVGVTDLDWSPDTLRRRMAGSHFPWVTANVVDSLSRRPAAWAVPYSVVTAGRRKIAVVGYTASRLGAVPNGGASDLATVRGLDGVKDALAAARAERPDFVIVLANADGPELAAALPAGSIDAIVTAGAGIDTVINGIAVLGGAPGGGTVAAVDLVRTVVGARTFRRQVDTAWADQPKPDTAEAAILARYHLMVDSLGRLAVAQVKLPLSRQGTQSPLGNLVADAWRNALRTDIAIVADSELLTDLPAGPISFDALRSFIGPYALIGLRSMNGRDLKKFLDGALAAGQPPLHVAGLIVTYEATAAAGRRIKDVHLPDGSKLRDNTPYTVAATAKVLLPDARPAVLGPGGRRALDALQTYLRALPQPVEAPEQPRLVLKH